MPQKKRNIAKKRGPQVTGRPIRVGLVAVMAAMVLAFGVFTAFATGERFSQAANDNSSLSSVSAPQSEKIEAGSVIEKDINGTETQEFSFDLDAGMYLRITVNQKVGDVSINLLNLKGETVHEGNRAGLVSLSAIADEATTFRIKIDSLQRAGVSGKYDLKLENLHAARAEDRQRLEAERLVNEGLSLGKSKKKNQVDAAIKSLTKAVRIWEKLEDSRELATTYYYLALRFEDQADNDNARKADERALELSRQSFDQTRELAVLGHLGSLMLRVGELNLAEDYYTQAANASRSLGNEQYQMIYLANSGLIARRRQSYDGAINYYNQALVIARKLGDETYEASILNNLAISLDLKGETQQAIETYNQIIPIWRKTDNLDGESATLKKLGDAYVSLDQNERALQQYQLALEKSLQLGNPNREGHIRAGLAKALKGLSRDDEARSQIEQALTIFESMRARLANPSQRASFAASNRKYTDLMLQLMLKKQNQKVALIDQEKAFEFSERARARSLQEMLTAAKVDFRQGADTDLLAREAQLKKEIMASDSQRLNLLSSKKSDGKSSQADIELRRLYSQYENLVSEIRKSSPQLANLTQYQPVSLADLQNNLMTDKSVMLEYYLGDDQSYLIALTANSLNTYILPAGKKIEELTIKLYEAISAPGKKVNNEDRQGFNDRMVKAQSDFNFAAGELSRILIAPVSQQFGDRALIVIPDGVLNYLPFAALPDPRHGAGYKPLIVQNEIVNLPSAATYLTLKQGDPSMAGTDRSIAVFADPVFSREDPRFEKLAAANVSGADPMVTADVLENIITRGESDGVKLQRLKYSRLEADSIAAISGELTSVALDFNANRDFFKSSDLNRYRYIHIATHGLMNSKDPSRSGLVLSLIDENGKTRNGVMQLNDIYDLKLNADLVVLSACQTALGQEIKGEGVIGLTRGFMYAGARRVVSSLWMVDDAATAELMKNFYDGMLKKNLSPGASMRAAQISMWENQRWNVPYFWAAFTMQGSPR